MRTESQRVRQREYMREYRLRNKERDAAKEIERRRTYRHDNAERVNAMQADRRASNPDRYYGHNLKSYIKRKVRPKTPARVDCKARSSRRREIKRCKDQDALDLRVIARADAVVPRDLSRFTRASVIALIVARIFTGHLPMRLTKAHGEAATAEVLGQQERSHG